LSGRGAALTSAGTAIVDDIRLSMARIDAAAHRARDIGARRSGRLSIGFVSQALFNTLPLAIVALRDAVPDIDLVLREMSNTEQARALETGEIDLGLLHTPVTIAGKMNEKLIRRDPFVAVLPAAFPIEAKEKVWLRELARKGLVWFPQQQFPQLRTSILSTFRQAGFPLEVVQEANLTLTVISCVAAGCGISLLPDSVRSLTFNGVRFCEIQDGCLLPQFELSAIWPARSHRTLADRFAALIPAIT
jgi:DNA-binding transcriptional LysR family regulator